MTPSGFKTTWAYFQSQRLRAQLQHHLSATTSTSAKRYIGLGCYRRLDRRYPNKDPFRDQLIIVWYVTSIWKIALLNPTTIDTTHPSLRGARSPSSAPESQWRGYESMSRLTYLEMDSGGNHLREHNGCLIDVSPPVCVTLKSP